MKKKIRITLILVLLMISGFVYFKYIGQKSYTEAEVKVENSEENNSYSSNIIKDVNYSSTDAKGNEYIINASQGEIDYSNANVIFLTNVVAEISLDNSQKIKITSDFGKYNTENFDTIFSQNVIVDYLSNKITGEYLDFSLVKNLMIISKDVIYSNLDNTLKADVIEINIKTKNTRIFMHENKKKVNIINKK